MYTIDLANGVATEKNNTYKMYLNKKGCYVKKLFRKDYLNENKIERYI